MTRPWSQPARYLTLILIFALLITIAWAVREMFQPLVIAGLITYLMMPGVNILKKRTPLNHRWSANVVYFITLTLLLASPVLFVPELIRQIRFFSNDLLEIYQQIYSFFGMSIEFGPLMLNAQGYLPDLEDTLFTSIQLMPEQALRLLESASKNTAWFFVIIVTIYYLLADWDKVREWMIRQAPEPYRKDARRIFLEIKKIWAAYLRNQLALMFIVAIMFSIAWLLIGLPGALIIGILTGLFSIIPKIGTLLATLIALAVALLEGSTYLPLPNFWFGFLVVVIYLVLNNFKKVWLGPRLVSRNAHLHDGLVFVAIIAAVIFQGILGAIIIVPVIASLLTIGRYLRARILGRRPFPPYMMGMKKHSAKKPLKRTRVQPVQAPRMPQKRDD